MTHRIECLTGAGTSLTRMTEGFIERLPRLRTGQEQVRRWREIHEEGSVLVDWLPRVEEGDLTRSVLRV